MSRELKFRVWDHHLNKFAYFDIFTSWGNIPSDCKENIQSFTGICDKDEVSVYEGDILKVKGFFRSESEEYSIGVVEWNEHDCGYLINIYKNGKSDWQFFYINEIRERNDFYVIGNIFETPELLKNPEKLS